MTRPQGLGPPGSPAPWPILEEAALYGLAGEVVRTLLPHTEADPAALVANFLSIFGLMTGNPTGERPAAVAEDAAHPPRLFVLIVGDSARSRKSSALSRVLNLMSLVDRDFIATRLLTGYGSGEALIDDVAESADKRLLVAENEFTRILTVVQRDGSVLSPILRQAYDGDRLSVRTRKKRVVADEAHVAIIANTTLEELRDRVTNTDVASGFLNRFLIVPVKRSKVLPLGGSPDKTDLDRLACRINRSLMKALNLRLIKFSTAAEERWDKYYRLMMEDDPGGLTGKMFARSDPHVLRLAVAYALTDASATIEVEHLEAAWAMWQYCRAGVLHVFGLGPLAELIRAAALQAESKGLTLTDIHGFLGRRTPKNQIHSALRLLQSEGLIEVETEQTRGRSRKRIFSIEFI